MAGGRPREDKSQVAQQLLEWAKKQGSVHLCKFCVEYCDPPIAPHTLYKWGCEDEEFRKTYVLAKAYIAYKREEELNLGNLHPAAYNANKCVYDYFQEQHRKEVAEHEFKMKLAAENREPQNTKSNENEEQLLEDNEKLKEQNKALLEKLNELQNKLS